MKQNLLLTITSLLSILFFTLHVTDDIVRSQQNVADAFYGAHLIPQKITVRDNVWQNRDVAASLAAK